MSQPLADALEALRAAEKEQAGHYRRLSVLAETAGDEATAQRLHDLHADEQHHLSRLTARLIELGHTPRELAGAPAGTGSLEGWESVARAREEGEVRQYEALIAGELDSVTRALVEAIVAVERHHRDELAGKWTVA